jgi:hypothetical protein
LKLIRSSLLLLFAAAMLLPLAGCGGPGSDPQEVIDVALSRDSLLAAPIGDAQVEVASLGFEDAVLERQLLKIDRDTNEVLREALAGSATDSSGEGGDRGLTALIEDLAAADGGDLGGVAVEKVTGSIDVDGLVERIRPLSEEPGADESEVIPGIDELDQLASSLVAADFELFASEDDGSLERFDLILSLDDTENALPPSRIRFSLTGVQ